MQVSKYSKKTALQTFDVDIIDTSNYGINLYQHLWQHQHKNKPNEVFTKLKLTGVLFMNRNYFVSGGKLHIWEDNCDMWSSPRLHSQASCVSQLNAVSSSDYTKQHLIVCRWHIHICNVKMVMERLKWWMSLVVFRWIRVTYSPSPCSPPAPAPPSWSFYQRSCWRNLLLLLPVSAPLPPSSPSPSAPTWSPERGWGVRRKKKGSCLVKLVNN